MTRITITNSVITMTSLLQILDAIKNATIKKTS